MTGLEYLRSIVAGDLPCPPFLNTLEMVPQQIDEGAVSFIFEPKEFHYTQMGCVHGGMISTLLDTAMGCALHTLLDKGTAYATLELKVNFLRPVRQRRGKMTALGRIVQMGTTIALLEAQLLDKKGRIYAHSTSTFVIQKQK